MSQAGDADEALRRACARGDAPGVEALIAAGAAVDAADAAGWTPLLVASREGHPEIVGYLLACGADPAARTADGRGVVELARAGGHAQVLDELRHQGISLPGVG